MTKLRFFSVIRLIGFLAIHFLVWWMVIDNLSMETYCLNLLSENIVQNCGTYYPKLRSTATVLLEISSGLAFGAVGIWLFIVSQREISRPDDAEKLQVWWWVLLVIGGAIVGGATYFWAQSVQMMAPHGLVKVTAISVGIFLIGNILVSIFTLPRAERGATPGGNLIGGWLALW